jgi:hypothetical protein
MSRRNLLRDWTRLIISVPTLSSPRERGSGVGGQGRRRKFCRAQSFVCLYLYCNRTGRYAGDGTVCTCTVQGTCTSTAQVYVVRDTTSQLGPKATRRPHPCRGRTHLHLRGRPSCHIVRVMAQYIRACFHSRLRWKRAAHPVGLGIYGSRSRIGILSTPADHCYRMNPTCETANPMPMPRHQVWQVWGGRCYF